MTPAGRQSRLGTSVPVRAVRRVLAPAALELGGQVQDVQARLAELTELVGVLGAQNAELRERLEALEAEQVRRPEVDQLAGDVGELRAGLHEQRRLQLRVAEVTDLVTEVVLPLHDREVDPAVLARLRPDTL